MQVVVANYLYDASDTLASLEDHPEVNVY